MFNLTPVVKQLLIINIIMFIASMVMPNLELALYYPAHENFMPYQIISHFFMHGGLTHIFFNMFALVMFGSALETLWGPKKFLFYYFFCAIGAAALHTFVNYLHFSGMETALAAFEAAPTIENFRAFFAKASLGMLTAESRDTINALEEAISQNVNPDAVANAVTAMRQYLNIEMGVPVVGASGAIYGLLMAFGMLFPNAELMLIFLPIPIKAKYFIPLLMLGELFLGVKKFQWDNIAHFAHLGGALFGLLLILYWRKFDDSHRLR